VKTLNGAGIDTNDCLNPKFTSDYYTGTNSNCLKYNWAQNCKSIPAWEGITYGVHNPCATI